MVVYGRNTQKETLASIKQKPHPYDMYRCLLLNIFTLLRMSLFYNVVTWRSVRICSGHPSTRVDNLTG